MRRAAILLALTTSALLMSGCVTRFPDNARSYVSIAHQPYEREGCQHRRDPANSANFRHAMTRDRMSPAMVALPFRTYSYGTQRTVLPRPTRDQPQCLVMVREENSYSGALELLVGLEVEALDETSVRVTATRIFWPSAALWKIKPERMNLAVALGLVEDGASGSTLFSEERLDLGSVRLGQNWQATWPDDPLVEGYSTLIAWPESLQTARLVAVVGENRWGKPRPDPRVLALQTSIIASSSADWPPAR